MKLLMLLASLLIAKSAAYNPVDCDYTLATPTGLVRSPDFPRDYLHYANCSWLIVTAATTVIQLDFSNFVTEGGHDIVTIYDGPTMNSPLLLANSGTTLPSAIRSSQNAMYINFTSDHSIAYSGFSAQYISITPGVTTTAPTTTTSTTATTTTTTTTAPPTDPPTCGATMYGTGYVLSPNYPSNYFDNLDCTWYLQSNAAQTIAARFDHFDTEFKADLVTVIEGWDPLTGTVLLDKASGTLDPFLVETSRSNRMMIRFSSDDSISASGFRIFFASAINETTTTTTTTTTTPEINMKTN